MPPFTGPDHADDLRLVTALRERRPGTISELFDAYGPWLYDYAHSLLHDRDWAAEAVLSSLLTAYQSPASGVEPDRLRGWLYALLRVDCLERMADDAAPDRPAELEAASDMVLAHTDEPLRLERGRVVVNGALAILDAREREVIELTLRHGLSTAELAEVLNTPARRVALQAVHAQEQLAAALSGELGRQITLDQLPIILEVLPFAAAPADLGHRLQTAAAARDEFMPRVMLTPLDIARGTAKADVATTEESAEETGGGYRVKVGARSSTDILVAIAVESAAAVEPDEQPVSVVEDPTEALEPAETVIPSAQPVVKKPRRSRRRGLFLLGAGTIAGILLVVLMISVLLPGSSAGSRSPLAKGRQTASEAGAGAGMPSSGIVPPASVSPGSSPGASPSGSASPTSSSAPHPGGGPTQPGQKTKAPGPSHPSGGNGGGGNGPQTAGSLGVDDSRCRHVFAMGLPAFCQVMVTAQGGPVHWAVSGVSSGIARLLASGSGSLAAGQSASVSVVVRPTVACYVGGGDTGTVSFSPGGSATVGYTCSY